MNHDKSPLISGYLNEWWNKKNGRLSKTQCIELGKRLDEGWQLIYNSLEYIHIIYEPKLKLLSTGEIYD